MATREEKQAELQRLYDAEGYLTASGVLREAKRKRNPLHDTFQWDDSLAAHEYRIDQARHLIRTYEITYEGETGIPFHVPNIKVEEGESREGVWKLPAQIVQIQDEKERAMCALYSAVESANRNMETFLAAVKRPTPMMKSVARHLSKASEQLQAQRGQ